MVADVIASAKIQAQPAGAGQKTTPPELVHRWITERTGMVQLRLYGWDTLPSDKQAMILTTARAIVVTGAAATTDAYRNPGQFARMDQSYSVHLERQYATDLETLAAQVEEWLAGDDNVNEGPGITGEFPPTSVPDDMRLWR